MTNSDTSKYITFVHAKIAGPLHPIDVQGLYAAMEQDGKSARVRQLAHAVLRRGLKQAVPWTTARSHFHFDVFKPLLKNAKVPEIRFHDLRHTSASLLLAAGVHPKVVQERLGHSQIGITLDIYSHILPTMGIETAKKLDGVLRLGASKPKSATAAT